MTVECTLEEFFYGCQKEVFFKRILLTKDLQSEKTVSSSRVIEVKPGSGATKDFELRYPGEGHQRYAQSAGDLIIRF